MQKIRGIMFLCFAACHLHGMNLERTVSPRMQVRGALPHIVPPLSTQEYEHRSVAFCDFVDRTLVALLAQQKMLAQSSAPHAVEWHKRCTAMITFLENLSYSSRLTEVGQALVREQRDEQVTRDCCDILEHGQGQ